MAPEKPKRSRNTDLGVTIVVGLLLGLGGFVAAWYGFHVVNRQAAMRSWVEVPATITSVDQRVFKTDYGTEYQTTASYHYSFGGKDYTGDRVFIEGDGSGSGEYQVQVYKDLKSHRDQKLPFRCFVNPEAPSEAILYRTLRGEMLAMTTPVAVFFGSLGLAMTVGSYLSARRRPRNSLDADSENQPWLARDDWATGRVLAKDGAAITALVLAAITIYWHFAEIPLLTELPAIVRQDDFRWRWYVLLIPLIGIALIVATIYQWLHLLRYGESILQLASTPGVVGGQLAGVVRIPKRLQSDEGFRLNLRCIERKKGLDGKPCENEVWQEEQLVTVPLYDDAEEETAVPVLLAIPYEVAETSRRPSLPMYRWELTVSAKMPTVDYQTVFEVPMFRTADSRPGFRLDPQLVSQYAPPTTTDVLLLAAGIDKEILVPEGVRLVFRAARNWKAAIGWTAVFFLVAAMVFTLGPQAKPRFVTIAVEIGLVLLGWVLLRLWFHRSTATANSRELTVSGGLFGLGRVHRFAAEDIDHFTTHESLIMASALRGNIEVMLRNRRTRIVGRGIISKLAQQAVIDELTAALKLNATADGR